MRWKGPMMAPSWKAHLWLVTTTQHFNHLQHASNTDTVRSIRNSGGLLHFAYADAVLGGQVTFGGGL